MSVEPERFGHLITFDKVFEKEISVVNNRRQAQGRASASLKERGTDFTGERVLVPEAGSNLIGLSLSGGGICSAAFCLGGAQGIGPKRMFSNEPIIFPRSPASISGPSAGVRLPSGEAAG
jgi:hypothetical protein